MRRQLETIDLDCGAWVRLDCGHPSPSGRDPSATTAECALCDRAQLPAGLVPEGPPRNLKATLRHCRYELTPTGWAILLVEAGSVAMAGQRHTSRVITGPARVVLVAGVRYRIAPDADAVVTIQALRDPSHISRRPAAAAGTPR